MERYRRMIVGAVAAAIGMGVAWGCGFDDTLREYLSAQFWLPFVKSGRDFARSGVPRASHPFAGMQEANTPSPLAKLRAAYQRISLPASPYYDDAQLQAALGAAQADKSLTAKEREEVDLIDAKIDMRGASSVAPDRWTKARQKLERFLRSARTPAYRSEARGWLAHVHYSLGDQTAAGKIYLDELNRKGSNLSRETLLNSLSMTYRYDGGPTLARDLEQYFDTPEHAAFAIQLATNPRWNRDSPRIEDEAREPAVTQPPPYARATELLDKHGRLFRSARGAEVLAVLGMRTALAAGDRAAALRIAVEVPESAPVRGEPDFQWMLASALFVSRDYAAAEEPLLALFRSRRASSDQRCAAAYGLCGVYSKTGNVTERIRMALWLRSDARRRNHEYLAAASMVDDMSVYWAVSGWDLALLLDAEASIEQLQAFMDRYPDVPDVRIVRYALAVRLARADRYDESAQIYDSIAATRRAARMRRLATLHARASGDDGGRARYELAEYLEAHSTEIYFNNTLWGGLQRYAASSAKDGRLNREERARLMECERRLKDEQEERWRAYHIVRELMQKSSDAELRTRSARLALKCLRLINTERFEREDEIRKADIEISRWLRASR